MERKKTASIIIKQGEPPSITLTGWWAARDWHGLHRQFLETVRRQPPIQVAVEPTEEVSEKDNELLTENQSLKELLAEIKLKLKNKSKRKTRKKRKKGAK